MTNAELKSALMDTDEATKAADAEHTEVADVANLETQSIYAWSQDDDADTELAITHRRSWRLPIAVAALAVAAAGTVAAINFWPHQQNFAGQKTPLPAQTSAPVAQPSVAPAPSQQTSSDQRFIDAVGQYYGWSIPNDQRDAMLVIGRFACSDLNHGKSIPATADDLQTLGIDGQQDRLALARIASTTLCDSN